MERTTEDLEKMLVELDMCVDKFEGLFEQIASLPFIERIDPYNDWALHEQLSEDRRAFAQRAREFGRGCIQGEIARLLKAKMPDTEERAMKWLEEGKRSDDWEIKLNAYCQAIALNPDLIEAYRCRAQYSYEMNNYAEAGEDYEKVVKHAPDDVEAQYRLGVIKYFGNDYQAALAHLEKAIALQPDHAEAHNYRAHVKCGFAKFQEALEDYGKATTLNPTYAEAFWGRAYVYALLEKKQEAIDSLREAVRLDALYKDMAEREPMFDWLRGDADFDALLK